METSYRIALVLHILSGTLSLLCGTIAVISKKGGRWHRGSGKVFFYGMLGVCITSVFISVIRDNRFLLAIGIFSFYLNYFGYRAITNKTLKPSSLDWLVLALSGINSVLMICSMNLVLVVFGVFCLYAVAQNSVTGVRILQSKPVPKLLWLRRHIGMMMGAFISTLTAFLVVNFDKLPFKALPAWTGWLAPSMALVPLIVYYNQKYAKQPSQ